MKKIHTLYELTREDFVPLKEYLIPHGFSIVAAPISADIIDNRGTKRGRILGTTLGDMPPVYEDSAGQLQVFEDKALEGLIEDFYKRHRALVLKIPNS